MLSKSDFGPGVLGTVVICGIVFGVEEWVKFCVVLVSRSIAVMGVGAVPGGAENT